jgi:Heterokaryon incompatibility protein (HET)
LLYRFPRGKLVEMRLVNTETLKLQEFVGNEIPPYAILSHTWGADEVDLQDFKAVNSIIRDTAGYAKIGKCCETARLFGYSWAWVDTCTIDKTSSADLSEAINSMFSWYQKAGICFAYLSDVESLNPTPDVLDQLQRSRWFKRGWTVRLL